MEKLFGLLIDAFVQKMGEIRERGLNDEYAINSIKDATARLKKVGIPVESFSQTEEGIDSYNLSMTYSDEVFWEKLGGIGLHAGKTVVESALTLFYITQEPNVPTKQILLIGGALAYLILPVDAVPDFLPVVGFTDDLPVITGALATVCMTINTDKAQETARQKTRELFGDI